MDPMQLLAIVAVVLGLVLVGLTLVVVSMVRNQQAAQKQAARRVVEAEKQERSRLQALVARVDPMARKAEGDEILAAAKAEAERVRAEAARERAEGEAAVRVERDRGSKLLEEVERRERRVGEREDANAGLQRKLDERLGDLEVRLAELESRREELTEAEQRQRGELARIAGMTSEEARAELLNQVEHEARLQAVQLSREIEAEARRDGEAKARQIIVGAIQRLATEQTTESVVTTVPLPGDEMKGRIIGREGRNIRAFEQTTGVNVMIDDTPESVLLSSFDPVRREVARLTLTELVADGRIHPARIEEVYERSKRRIDEICLRAAEDAVAEVGLTDLDPGLLPTIGALQYRTSYGQNVLKHLVECAHLAALMASELQIDPAPAKRAAFLHDIGKALTHEVEGSHAKVGADLARRFGEQPDIVNAIEAHHNEVEPRTVIAVLTQAADAISGGRPGARRESLEVYVKRLQRLEEIARAHEGVDKVFAMQAGREIRVMVQPDAVDDAATHVMAKEIAKQVQDELTYPGSIKVTVVRESRAIETAH
ncbi:ribonuclease Y [Micropruina sonneratiae]|uniref:ribonuclease Y n=1 Tax=Micropruina sonneratiae TaxID=2986940 RepID=UPI002227B847|nr:ribonuclease Y [Micropruina sp. KQZ13P-5]